MIAFCYLQGAKSHSTLRFKANLLYKRGHVYIAGNA